MQKANEWLARVMHSIECPASSIIAIITHIAEKDNKTTQMRNEYKKNKHTHDKCMEFSCAMTDHHNVGWVAQW